MTTPKEYSINLKNNIITDEMLEKALYSVNKRAKNWRDKKREYRSWRSDIYNYADKAEEAEKSMYKRKEELLSLLSPICIHQEFLGFERIRVYDYQDDYKEIEQREMHNGRIVWRNHYYKSCSDYNPYDNDDYDDYDYEIVYFFDYEDREKPIFNYYLYYVLGNHSFHSPITEEEAEKLELPCFFIRRLVTEGKEIDDLVSVQFVDKLLGIIREQNYVRYGESMEPDYVSNKLRVEIEKSFDKEEYIREYSA